MLIIFIYLWHITLLKENNNNQWLFFQDLYKNTYYEMEKYNWFRILHSSSCKNWIKKKGKKNQKIKSNLITHAIKKKKFMLKFVEIMKFLWTY